MSQLKSSSGMDASTFKCGICLELQYKPCVNTCGHSFCFWCMHRAMDYLNTTHACPLCRAAFRHFPAVCMPLHRYLARQYPEEMKRREEETLTQEREEFHADSPSVPIQLDGEKSDIRRAFACEECGGLAAPPLVLPCGHIVCRGSGGRVRQWKRCPVDGCCGSMMAGDGEGKSSTPAVCAAIDTILSDGLTQEEYDEAVAKSALQCQGLREEDDTNGAAQSRTDANANVSISFAPGDSVTVQGLTSTKGTQLNGRRAVVKSYCESSGRYTVSMRLPRPSTKDYECQVKPENLLKECETYVHYGVGCDGCGVFPIVGRRYKCQDCSEEVGFDLCGTCFDDGVHEREAGAAGRFNQHHRPCHSMEEVAQEHTVLHEIQRRHPNTPLSQIVEMINMQAGDDDAGDGTGDGSREEDDAA